MVKRFGKLCVRIMHNLLAGKKNKKYVRRLRMYIVVLSLIVGIAVGSKWMSGISWKKK